MTIADLFDSLAITTWKAIGRAYDRGIRIGEDAITTYNLLALDALSTSCVVAEDTRVDESTKGCDFELWVGGDLSGWRRYAVQAKRLDVRSGRYRALSHKVGAQFQLDVLEQYAAANSAYPIYCLYNYRQKKISTWNCGIIGNPEHLGCSITDSKVIRNAVFGRGRHTFADIHRRPETLPWSCLVKCPFLYVGRHHGRPRFRALDWSNFFIELPESIERLRSQKDPRALVDAPDTFSFELGRFPSWVGVVDVERDTQETYSRPECE